MNFIKKNKKVVLAFIIGVLVSGGVVYAAQQILASDITYDNTSSGLKKANGQDVTNMQEAVDALTAKANSCGCGNVSYCSCKKTPVYRFKEQILADNPTIKETPSESDLRTAATTSAQSGLFQMTTSSGFGGTGTTTYFFRGAVTNNVVEFAGKIWRIVRINEDGSVRLILDTSIDSTEYWWAGIDVGYSYVYYSNNDIKGTVDSWYAANITGANAEKVATGNYFCDAAKVGTTTSFGSATPTLYSSYTPNLNCVADDGNGKGYVNSNVGLLTYDEAVLAGSYKGVSNTEYYLYKGINSDNNYEWWTMSPKTYNSSGNGGNCGDHEWSVGYNNVSSSLGYNNEEKSDIIKIGYAACSGVAYDARLRPVINLKADTYVTKASNGHYIVQ